MFSFANDYSEGACPEILQALIKTNFKQTPGYGEDQFCEKARFLIRKQLKNNEADIHFVPGGTPANLLAISLLKPYEAVICVDTGHINTHETGAVENTGHKILTVPSHDGKINALKIEEIVAKHTDEHMVKPKMVFISNSTELGTIYHKKELTEIYDTCKKLGLYLYMDGARIANALVTPDNDLNLADISSLTDIFYIGGTKNGALLGEAFIIMNNELKTDFRYALKQKGMMLAKSRVIGIEFMTLFENGLYFNLAKNANVMAQTLRQMFIQLNIPLYVDSPTNQIFVIMSDKMLKRVKTKYAVTEWGRYDNEHMIVRIVCSWATKEENIKEFCTDLILFNKK